MFRNFSISINIMMVGELLFLEILIHNLCWVYESEFNYVTHDQIRKIPVCVIPNVHT